MAAADIIQIHHPNAQQMHIIVHLYIQKLDKTILCTRGLHCFKGILSLVFPSVVCLRLPRTSNISCLKYIEK